MRAWSDIPRIPLGVFPTPVQRLDNISRTLGTNVFVKLDDLTGLGLGGNKVRKLEFLLADAKQKGCEIVFTTGGAQSNHAMLTAAAAKRLGMTPILILKKRGVTSTSASSRAAASLISRGVIVSKGSVSTIMPCTRVPGRNSFAPSAIPAIVPPLPSAQTM